MEAAIGRAITFMLVVSAIAVFDFLTGGWVRTGLSALWSLILGS